jgi:hypothetical protein
MYTALKEKYTTAGKFTELNKRGEQVQVEYFYVSWQRLGTVKDMAEAKRVYGGSPVLASDDRLHP